MRPAGCAGPRRPKAWPRNGPATGSPGPTSHRKLEPDVDLLEDALGDHRLAVVEVEVAEAVGGLGDGQEQSSCMLSSSTVTASASGFSRAPSQVAHGTSRMYPSIASRGRVGLGLAVAPLEVRDDALVLGGVAACAAVAVAELDFDAGVVAHAVEQQLLLRCRELTRTMCRRRCRTPRRPTRAAGGSTWRGPRPRAPWRRSADRELRVGHDQLGVDLEDGAQAVACRAGAVGRVEREVSWGEFLEALAVRGARQLLGEGQQFRLGVGARHLCRAPARSGPRPRPSCSAVSIESVRRRSMPSRSTSRSTMTSMVCCS